MSELSFSEYLKTRMTNKDIRRMAYDDPMLAELYKEYEGLQMTKMIKTRLLE